MRTQMFGADADGAVVAEATTIGFYLIYAFIAVGLVVFLARTLARNGEIFLQEAFEREELAASVNQLLVIGFYLLNLGYALLVYRVQGGQPSLIAAFSDLMVNLGILLASLGVLHLVNMAVLWRIGGQVFKRKTPAAAPALTGADAPAAWKALPPPPVPTEAMAAPGGTTTSTDRYPEYSDGSDLLG